MLCIVLQAHLDFLVTLEPQEAQAREVFPVTPGSLDRLVELEASAQRVRFTKRWEFFLRNNVFFVQSGR